MFPAPALAAINHLLQAADWARGRVAPFAGSVVQVDVAPFSGAFQIQADGTLAQAAPDTRPSASIRLSAPTAVRLMLLHDERARQEVSVEGDAALASTLTGVLSQLRWDVEEDLSRVVGDIAAHRLVQAGESLVQWQRDAMENFARSLVEYSTHEQPLIASREAVRDFITAVDALRDDVERLEKRIERLARGATSKRNE